MKHTKKTKGFPSKYWCFGECFTLLHQCTKKTNNSRELIEVAQSMISEIYEHYIKAKESILKHNLILADSYVSDKSN